jgi:hypothetical protein
MNEQFKEIQLNLYDLPKRDIKIKRFFEVVEYLTKFDLWRDVKSKMVGDSGTELRMMLDSNLGNAVKEVVFEHIQHINEIPGISKKDEELAFDVIQCDHTGIKTARLPVNPDIL